MDRELAFRALAPARETSCKGSRVRPDSGSFRESAIGASGRPQTKQLRWPRHGIAWLELASGTHRVLSKGVVAIGIRQAIKLHMKLSEYQVVGSDRRMGLTAG